ncbi:Oidioi.mRNA.OKI2018_I69.chr1.g1762.t1.cds [Oikopleura dioica]|uniref:Oidioi.mRNA.OKI2018_I69.chr1.g1762.t1.cds n=1 Tax=Oikopleura dioica TaxID=34765 RepID=A0ABN7SNX5_OIKDI|nr:Oidioi.mRNA.OKI2018_I69.chr1.g1762.t1.cds [Oikopleura dioica]
MANKAKQLVGHKLCNNVSLDDGFVTSHGSFGKCAECQQLRRSTTEINGERYCKICFLKHPPGKKIAVFEETNAKFRCYKKCGANQLSWRDFFIGSCCEDAASWIDSKFKYDILAAVNQIYEELLEEEKAQKNKRERAHKKVEDLKKQLEMAENDAVDADQELECVKVFRRKVQKRSLFLTKETMKDDNPDLDTTDEVKLVPEEKEVNEKLRCKVCFETYDEEHPQAAVIPCGHKACLNCLSSLPQKNCPTCRAEFTDDKIFKLFD